MIFVPENENDLPFVERPELIVEIPTSGEIQGVIALLLQQYQIDESLVNAALVQSIIQQESSNNPQALRCEQSIEDGTGSLGPWRELVDELDCAQYGCDTLIQSDQGILHKVSCSYGLMQLLYITAREYCEGSIKKPEDLFDVNKNIACGIAYLKFLSEKCETASQILYGYNHGSRDCETADVDTDEYVVAVRERCESIVGCVIA